MDASRVGDPAKIASSPEDEAGALSRAVHWWAWGFFKAALCEIRANGSLRLDSLPPMSHLDSPDKVMERLGVLLEEEHKTKRPSLLRAVCRWHRRVVIQQSLVGVVYALGSLAVPGLLRPLVLSLQGELPLRWGYAAVVGVAAMAGVNLLVQQYSWSVFDRMGRQIWLGLVGYLCRKPAQLDTATFQGSFTEGQVIAMIGQDAPLFPNQFPFMFIFVAGPMIVLLGSVIMFVLLREAFISGFVVSVVLTVASERAAGYYKAAIGQKFKCADERVLIMGEAMRGMHYVKLCHWEDAVERRVAAVRAREMAAVRRVHAWYAVQMGLAAVIPILATVTTFATQAALDREFESTTVLLALGCFEMMATGFIVLPSAFMYFKTFALAINRVGRLIMTPSNYSHCAQAGQGNGLSIEDGTFKWDTAAQEPALQSITLKAGRGELVAVVGRVASGKTTLAAAAFGLCHRTQGHVRLDGRCAYAPQSPQILNATLRENVLFGEPFDNEKYKKALRACSLVPDLKQLTHGDRTEIGEKGITISGGQRARIALARAIFSSPDVAILDDPLSAMDPHVGQSVFENCILGSLRNKGCAVLLLTNQLQFCKAADRILVLDHGRVVEEGTFKELQAPGTAFAEMYATTASAAHQAEATAEIAGETAEEGSCQPPKEDATSAIESSKLARPSITRELSQMLEQHATEQHVSAMQQESAIEGRIGLREFQRISYTGQSKLLGAVLVIFCVSAPFFMFATSVSLTRWTAKANEEHFLELLLCLLAGGLYTLATAGRTLFSALFFAKVSARLHSRMVGAVLRQCMRWYDTTPVGRIMNRCSQDVSNLDLMVPRYFEFTLQHAGAAGVGFFGAALLVWPSLIVILPLMWFVWQVYCRYAAVSLDLQRLMLHYTSPLMSHVGSFLSALDTIRAFGKEGFFEGECQSSMSDVCRVFYWIHSLDRMVMTLLVLISVPALVLLVGMGTLLLSDLGLVDQQLGALGVALSCGIAMRVPLLIWCAAMVEKFLGGAQRVREYAELPLEGDEYDKKNWVLAHSPAGEEDWPVKGSLELEGVYLRYQPGLPLVLCGLNLAVAPGERLGICGRTGSGKSTLFLACFRLVEAEAGRVIIDGREAVNVSLSAWRRRLAIVPQDPLMFSGTLRFNLDIHGKYSDDRIWEVLRVTCLEQQIKQLEHGLDEPVQEMGSNFSAGTVQLLSIARVLLGSGQVSVVFLDECTASVDYKTDRLVQKAVKTAFSGRSVVCIAHRIQTILDYDKIAFLRAGQVAEYGAPKELLAKPAGNFAEVVTESGQVPQEILAKLNADSADMAREHRLLMTL